jgi:hypothetical protein
LPVNRLKSGMLGLFSQGTWKPPVPAFGGLLTTRLTGVLLLLLAPLRHARELLATTCSGLVPTWPLSWYSGFDCALPMEEPPLKNSNRVSPGGRLAKLLPSLKVPVAVNFTSEPAQLGLVPVVCVKLTELMLTLGVTLSATLLLLATGVLLLMHARLLLTEQLTGPATGLDMAKSRPCMVSTVPPHTALNSLAGRLLKGLPSLNMPSTRKATSVALLHVGLVPLTWLTTTLLGTMLSAGLTLNAKSGGEATLPLLLTQLRELLTLLACTLTLLLAWKPKPWPVMVSAPALHVALRSALALEPSL